MPGDFIARLDRIVEFREPLGPATKYFLKKLRTAYIVETSTVAERMAHDNPHSYFLTPDGTCYHGRTVSGGRKGDAGPLALKRELRHHETEAARLDRIAQEQQSELTRLESEIAAGRISTSPPQSRSTWKRRRRSSPRRTSANRRATNCTASRSTLAAEREEIARLHVAAESARERAEQARREHEEAIRSRAAAESEAAEAAESACDAAPRFSGSAGGRGRAPRRAGNDLRAPCERRIDRAAPCGRNRRRRTNEWLRSSSSTPHCCRKRPKLEALLRTACAAGGIAACRQSSPRRAEAGARKGMGRSAVAHRTSG